MENVENGRTHGLDEHAFFTSYADNNIGGTDIPIGLRCFLEEPFVTYTFGAGVIIENRLGSVERQFPMVEIIPIDAQYKI